MNRKIPLRKPSLLLAVLLLATAAFLPATSASAGEEPPLRSEVVFSGVITAVPANAGEPWVIAGTTVATGSYTRIVLTRGIAEPGMWASVVAKRQDDGSLLGQQITVMPAEVRIKGVITAMPTSSDGVGVWTIAGQAIIVTADTVFSQRGGPVGLGRWVEVVAVEEPAGTLTALRMRGIVPLPAQEIWGAIQVADSDCWVLSSISLAVNDETLIVSVPQVGVLARAAAILQADGSLLAQRLLVSWLEVGVLHQPIEFTGTIEALPPKGLNGVWTVSGQTVNVIPATAINQEKGMAVVGAEVKIIGWQAPTRFTAVEITVLSSPLPGGEEVNFYGPIEAMPAEGPLGTWTIGGQQVIVNERTRLGGAEWAQIGLLAEGAGIRWADGTIVATWMMILPIPYPQPSAMPHL